MKIPVTQASFLKLFTILQNSVFVLKNNQAQKHNSTFVFLICAEFVPFLFVTENRICELIEFRPRSLQLLIYGLLGVNLDYCSAVQVFSGML